MKHKCSRCKGGFCKMKTSFKVHRGIRYYFKGNRLYATKKVGGHRKTYIKSLLKKG